MKIYWLDGEEEDEEDVDDTEEVATDVDAVDADAEAVATDEPIDSIGDEGSEEMTDSEEGGLEDYEDSMGAEEVPSGEEMDMTTASDEEVISVYKKLTGDDEIQIVSNDAGDIELTVNEPGEFVIKANDGAVEGGEVEAEPEMGMELEPEMGIDSEEEETYEESYDVNESQVVYEIALDEMEDIESVSAPVGNENEDNLRQN